MRIRMGTPKIMSMDETMDYIIEYHCSVSRFGDGELKLAIGEDISFQKCSKELQRRLCEILKSDNDKCLICVPDYFRGAKWMKYDSQEFMWRRVADYREKWTSVIDTNRLYGNASVSRCYYDWKDKFRCKNWFDKMKLIWNNQDVVFIEGEQSRLGYHNDLFDNAKSIKRILCPKTDAYDCYENILKASCENIDKNSLVLIALGPAATVLAYDMSLLGYQSIDIGHIDIEYEWFKLGAKEKVKIKDKFTNEANDEDSNNNISDREFEEQIICKING